MLAIDRPDKLLQREFKLSPAQQPGAMDTVTGTIHIAATNTIKAEQNIAGELRPDSLQLIRKSNDRACAHARDRSKRPFVVGPIIRGDKLGIVPCGGDSMRESLQVRFGTASRRVAAPNKSYAEIFRHAS